MLTEAQRRILTGLLDAGTLAISASEASEARDLISAGLVETFDFNGELGSGQGWWIPVWRITDAGRAALTATGGGDAI